MLENTCTRTFPSEQEEKQRGEDYSMLLSLPDECHLAILEFLPDLSDVACTCRRLRDARNHHILDQMRIAVINCRSATTSEKLLRTFQTMQTKNHGPANRFHRHAVALKITDAYKILPTFIGTFPIDLLRWCLPRVQRLDLSCVSDNALKNCRVNVNTFMFLATMLPNLRDIDLSGLEVNQFGFSFLPLKSPYIECIRWNDAGVEQILTGQYFASCHALKELYMDRSVFVVPMHDEHAFFWDNVPGGLEKTILCACQDRLERVSLQGVQYRVHGGINNDGSQAKPFTQASLMRFVRTTPALRWFRSDLTPANVALLQRERPGINFC